MTSTLDDVTRHWTQIKYMCSLIRRRGHANERKATTKRVMHSKKAVALVCLPRQNAHVVMRHHAHVLEFYRIPAASLTTENECPARDNVLGRRHACRTGMDALNMIAAAPELSCFCFCSGVKHRA